MIQSDFSHLEGTNCYCDADSALAIRQAISGLPLCDVHCIGTGDYHYVSLFWLERIREPFCLVLFDNHPDDQQTAFGGDLLSCGSWVAEARKLPMCKAVLWYDGNGQKHGTLEQDLPVYISVDLDILDKAYAVTDWDQGCMTLDWLIGQIEELRSIHRLAGADICGGITESKGAMSCDLRLNSSTVETLAASLAQE